MPDEADQGTAVTVEHVDPIRMPPVGAKCVSLGMLGTISGSVYRALHFLDGISFH